MHLQVDGYSQGLTFKGFTSTEILSLATQAYTTTTCICHLTPFFMTFNQLKDRHVPQVNEGWRVLIILNCVVFQAIGWQQAQNVSNSVPSWSLAMFYSVPYMSNNRIHISQYKNRMPRWPECDTAIEHEDNVQFKSFENHENHSCMILGSKLSRMLTAFPVTGREGKPLLLLGGSNKNFLTVSSCFQALHFQTNSTQNFILTYENLHV